MGYDAPFPLVAASSWLLLVFASIMVWVFSSSTLLKSAAKATLLSCLLLLVAMLLFIGFFVWVFGAVGGPTSI